MQEGTRIAAKLTIRMAETSCAAAVGVDHGKAPSACVGEKDCLNNAGGSVLCVLPLREQPSEWGPNW